MCTSFLSFKSCSMYFLYSASSRCDELSFPSRSLSHSTCLRLGASPGTSPPASRRRFWPLVSRTKRVCLIYRDICLDTQSPTDCLASVRCSSLLSPKRQQSSMIKCTSCSCMISVQSDSLLSERNALTVDGHFAWAVEVDLVNATVRALNPLSNSFCATGSFLSNGTFVSIGGNPVVITGTLCLVSSLISSIY